MGYSARVPLGAHGCCGCGVVPAGSRFRFGCAATSATTRRRGVCRARSPRSSSSHACACPPCYQRRLCVRPRSVGSVGSAPSARHVGGCMSGTSSEGGAAAGPLRWCSQRGPRLRDVTNEYSSGTPPYGVQCAGTFRGSWLVWVRHSTAERPSRLRVRRYLSDIALTGSVPSSLSALTKLVALCVPRSCQRGLRVRPRRVGSVGSAPSARHVGGCMSWASSEGGAAAGLFRYSQTGPLHAM
jgi:hypothetical protein